MAQRWHIRPLTEADKPWVQAFIRQNWGSELMIAHGTQFYPHNLPGFAAFINQTLVGLVTYHLNNNQCEITSLDSKQEGTGIGSALIEAVKAEAISVACKRLWLITTNDNLHALGFYQRRGFELVAVHRHAVEESRQLKPEIPLIGDNNIPLRDEIELELLLD